jgi:hypothetical protein
MNPRLVLGAALLAAGVASPAAQSPSINGRHTTADAVISGSPKLRDGAFKASGVSGVCGVIPKEASLTGEAAFVIEFPNDTPTGTITSISFGSKQLVGGVTTSTVFRLSVGVRTANGGRPPNYVLNTDSANAKASGTATLSDVKGVTTLRVIGREVMGETIELTVVCS